jgi:hypothetical protein
MDPVTVGAVLLAITSGAGEGLGARLWDGVASLVLRPLHHKAGAGGDPAVVTAGSTGEAELAALQMAPADKRHAEALARVLLARADADAEFNRALETWWMQAAPILTPIGNVANVISGGSQQGPVLQGRDFSNITFGTAPAAPAGTKAPE